MLEYRVSLYTSIYWTKRVIVVFVLIAFLCTGIKIFQFISNRLSVQEIDVGSFKAEAGYGKLPALSLKSREGFHNFKPSRYRITTTSGNLDVENGYPLETTKKPLINVYRVIEQKLDLGSSQEAVRIAREMGFVSEPLDPLNIQNLKWVEGERTLTINGQYRTFEYSNKTIKTKEINTPTNGTLTNRDQVKLRSTFQKVLTEFNIPVSLDNYIFTIQYLNYDVNKNTFTISNGLRGGFYRINAKRIYPNLSKGEKANAFAAYPEYSISNNYVILINSANPTEKTINILAEMKLFNWPLNTVVSAQNDNIQTYYVITPTEAYQKLSNNQAFLVSATEALSGIDIEPHLLENIDTVDLLNIRIDFYEEPIFRKYIQPIYVFTVEAQKNEVKYNLIYYLPAIASEHLL